MLVYHGSYLAIPKPILSYGRFNLDFGKGFYVTTLKEQSEKWAERRSILKNKKPIVSVYEFDDSELNVLYFDGYTEEWLDFVVKNRARDVETLNIYDAVFGNIADDDVAATVDDYMSLLSKNRVNADVKRATLYQLTFSKPNNQYCIASQKGIEALNFIKSYETEG
ncbi:MAG: DUF3990 domain-containing protein [Oscillospiraceae bacterium]|nr:DUF3990 domain-containing protein [Oscillospiraceae bacterium]